MGIILFSIPFFFVLMGVELAYAAWSRRRLFRLNDSIADLSCGILSQVSGVFSKLFAIGIYVWAWRRLAVQRWLPAVPMWADGAPFARSAAFPGFAANARELAAWTAAFVLVDLAYYWSHRLSHEINLLWAGHVVHHSSEEYNLAVALRQSSIHGLFTWVFYVPLALIGIPPATYVTCYALNLLYQFWIHTRAVGRMGRWTERVMNTPSHHRVHHGRNPRYLDRNHAGVLIVWDRLFGTFQAEEEEPVYGITKPLRSWNPLWANVHGFVEIARDAMRARSWRDRWMYVAGPPGWRSAAEGGSAAPPQVAAEVAEAWDPVVPAGLAAYGFAQFAAALAGSFALLLNAASMPGAHVAAAGFYVAISLAGVGGVFESAKWAGPIETARLLVLGAACALLGWMGAIPVSAAAAGVAFCAVSLAWFLPRRAALTETELAPIM
ncbi:sterol desaturase family protein [Longimicrobium sp.]|uniref:sterol desaturase family protein n=1 Tax=Longimicrobium sp. TaxID=2029185 RepID=UPI002B9CD7A0|nr:sterol desaturase family protein [Longimicrobium sp.]HSU12491.1 sterol desaturase family protein [Longimicrobium sp.]